MCEKLTPAQQAKLPDAKLLSVHIRQVAQLLKAEGIAIEPQLLFTANGRKKLRPQLMLREELQVKPELADQPVPAGHLGRPAHADTEVAYSAAIPPKAGAQDRMVVKEPEVLAAVGVRPDSRVPLAR
ncbi:MAG TPA: hypothetical protein VFR51_19275 [Pyrinomonadaceae bacterium]|nr:hypothetical protein [Pyrinomonadaceae bacterium]